MRAALGTFLKITALFLLMLVSLAQPRAFAETPLFEVISADGAIRFPVTEEVLEKVGTKSFRAALPSTDQANSLVRGPLLRDIVAASGLTGTMLTVRALDGYEMDIPGDDFMKNDVILAVEVDGKRLTRRERGPAWVAYPSVDYPRFQDDVYLARSVWQVKEIIVK